jgi:major type 1 subunit fimbrin (pilin)
MKFTRSSVLAIAIATAFGMPAVSHAADGTITITGLISSQTCTINGGTGGSNNIAVTLPTVAASALATAGTTAGRTPFSIKLTQCANTGSVSAYFEQAGTPIDVVTGNLTNPVGATNVEVGLLNADATAISLGVAQASQNSKSVSLTGSAGSAGATLNYFAQYVANGGAATAGTVTTTVLYSLVYQ